MSELSLRKGLPTCDEQSQVATKVGGKASSARNSGNNAWYVNINNGNRNNNNTYNRNYVCGASELIKDRAAWMEAERAAYKNKHHNFDAARVHYHLPELFALAREVEAGDYRPRPMTRFVLTYPCYRDAFAPDHLDCIVDHYTAPLFTAVAESRHAENCNISHGNRIGYSAQGMAERLRDDIAFMEQANRKPCYRMHRDIAGFFLHINRRQAYELVEKYSEHFYPHPDRAAKLAVLRTTLLNDPLRDVINKYPDGAIDKVPAHKRMDNAPKGCGLPIGKYPSQVVAGIVLAEVDEALVWMPGISVEHFVDDYDIIACSPAELHKAAAVMGKVLAGLGMELHPRKVCIQPAHRGMKSCGRVVKGGRIYISKRTVHDCKMTVRELEVSEEGAGKLLKSLNSTFGIMYHCNEYKRQREIADLAYARGFGEWLYFREEPGHMVCVLKAQYKPQRKAALEIEQLIKLHENETWKIHERNYRPRRSRGRSGNRRSASKRS